MTRILVWDLPTRLFHWLFVALFAGAFASAEWARDEGPWFPVHMLLGLVLGFVVLLRIIWGLIGTRYARFGSFLFGPRETASYFGAALAGSGQRYAGHNPGSGHITYLMLALLLAIAVSGLLLASGGSEVWEEVHELATYAMLAAIGVHLLGLAWHTVCHRENIAASMIHGTKQGDPADAIPAARPLANVMFITSIALFSVGVYRSYDPQARQIRVPLIGASFSLSEDGAAHDEQGSRALPPSRDDED